MTVSSGECGATRQTRYHLLTTGVAAATLAGVMVGGPSPCQLDDARPYRRRMIGTFTPASLREAPRMAHLGNVSGPEYGEDKVTNHGLSLAEGRDGPDSAECILPGAASPWHCLLLALLHR